MPITIEMQKHKVTITLLRIWEYMILCT